VGIIVSGYAMTDKLTDSIDYFKPLAYQIKLKGHLDPDWADWFDGLDIALAENGETLITGLALDQSALHGLLKKVRDLGMPLLSVTYLKDATVGVGTINLITQKEKIMNISNSNTERLNQKTLLSTVWIFAVVNYLYCDVMTLMDSAFLKQFMQGNVGGVATTQGFFLAAAILMEISMSMILLSRILKYKVNRWANIIAGTITTVVQFSSLFFGSSMPSSYYIFFSIMEIASTAFVVVYAWRWRDSTVQISSGSLK
jgi:hypothetical protein